MVDDIGALYNFLAEFLWPQSIWFIFWYGLLSATILPGASEVIVYLSIQSSIHPAWIVGLVATVGNTLGGLISYGVGKLLPNGTTINKPKTSTLTADELTKSRAQVWINQYGAWALLLSWLPIIGDALCIVAGWMRLDLRLVTLCMFIGKGFRYLVLILLALQLA